MSIQYLNKGSATKGLLLRPVGYSFPTGLTFGSFTGSLTVEYLVVAGGGGAGGVGPYSEGGGGGGAGGFRTNTGFSIDSADALTVTVGGGGPGGVLSSTGTSGANSIFGSITSTGGGGGATEAGGEAGWQGAAKGVRCAQEEARQGHQGERRAQEAERQGRAWRQCRR